jgi:hypothetical protein
VVPPGPARRIRDSDVIVAVDGIRIRDMHQYPAVKYQSWRPDMQFTIWRDGYYLEVKTSCGITG